MFSIAVRRSFRPSLIRSRNLHQQNVFLKFANKVLDNPLPLGAGALVVGLLQLRRIREREIRKAAEEQEVEQAPDWQVSCYRLLPLRHLSRLWGAVNEVQLPKSLRNFVLGTYIKAFGCDLAEAADSNLESYQSLAEFFRRRLKSGVRPIDSDSCIVSPADGKVLQFSKLAPGDMVEQVKGVQYNLSAFLGDRKLDIGVRPKTSTTAEDNTSTSLYQCVIYLAPGDYHGFHNPVDWTVSCRRHFPGELLSVNPKIMRLVSNLFALNERVSYLGEWKHGFFSMTAVGATNVGSVKVEMDPELCTNVRRWEKDTFHQKNWDTGIKLKQGDFFGEFNLGSTIVLIFEAPENFTFSFGCENNIVRVGKSIGALTKLN